MGAPVAVFGYCRAAELGRTLGALSACRGFAGHPVHLFLDGARGRSDAPGVARVRELAGRLDWPNLTVHMAEHNRGLRQSVLEGVSELVAAHGSAIVIEDDLLLAPAALEYFSAGLDKFADEERVKAVCGYQYKLQPPAAGNGAFFLPFASSWGWATWRRAWDPFVERLPGLINLAFDRAFLRRFDRQGIIAASTMLKGQQQGLIDSWAILWNAHITELDGLVLYPAETMVLNGGFASEGATHASRGNPINRVLAHMSEERRLADGFSLPHEIRPDVRMRQRVANSGEARLHRLSARLGYWRRRARRLAPLRNYLFSR